ncbi:MAG: QueT transporter family protein [Eubacteriales bacterium]|nr:QueT transporter family protein [Eubacteriales bacterium]
MNKTKIMTQGALIAALYVVLTFLVNMAGLASGVVQLRLSEALCVLTAFTPAAIPGLFVGCLLANMLTGCLALDVIFGGLATLIGAIGGWMLRKKNGFIISIPTIIANTLIVPFILRFVYGSTDTMIFMFITVFIGELISAGVLGSILHSELIKRKNIFK